MTRTTRASLLVCLTVMLGIGCGGGQGLVVGGNALVRDSAGTESGFRFDPAGVHLAGGMGTNSGMCTISRHAAGSYGIVVDLYGDAQGTGHALRSMDIMVNTDDPQAGQITADLGGTEFSSTTCRIDATSLDEGRGNVTLTATDCPLTAGTETATANIHLDLAACTVVF
jgi:hypothetical protein